MACIDLKERRGVTHRAVEGLKLSERVWALTLNSELVKLLDRLKGLIEALLIQLSETPGEVVTLRTLSEVLLTRQHLLKGGPLL